MSEDELKRIDSEMSQLQNHIDTNLAAANDCNLLLKALTAENIINLIGDPKNSTIYSGLIENQKKLLEIQTKLTDERAALRAFRQSLVTGKGNSPLTQLSLPSNQGNFHFYHIIIKCLKCCKLILLIRCRPKHL